MNSLSGFFGTPFSLVLDIVFLIALSIFLYFFLRSKDKNNAYIMIVILTLSYVGFPILNIYATFVITNRIPTKIEGCIASAVYVFNLWWTTIYALYTYRLSKSILEAKTFNFVQFFTKAAIFSFIVSSIFPLLVVFNVWGDSFHFFVTGSFSIGYYIDPSSPLKLPYFIIRDGLGRMLPTLATSFCYYKLYYLLKDSKAIVNFSGTALRRLFWSSMLPVLCGIPGILHDISDYFAPFYFSPYVSFTTLVLRYFWEFLNLWAYWKLNPTAVGRDRLESCVALNSTFEL